MSAISKNRALENFRLHYGYSTRNHHDQLKSWSSNEKERKSKWNCDYINNRISSIYILCFLPSRVRIGLEVAFSTMSLCVCAQWWKCLSRQRNSRFTFLSLAYKYFVISIFSHYGRWRHISRSVCLKFLLDEWMGTFHRLKSTYCIIYTFVPKMWKLHAKRVNNTMCTQAQASEALGECATMNTTPHNRCTLKFQFLFYCLRTHNFCKERAKLLAIKE